jgi:hypothetical protein
MGVDVPKRGLKQRQIHRVHIELVGPLSKTAAKALKRDLDRVLDRYRKRLGGMKPGPTKRSTYAAS